MNYILCNWIGVINSIPRTKEQVLETVDSACFKGLGWFFLPTSEIFADGKRYNSLARRIKSTEDLMYYETKQEDVI